MNLCDCTQCAKGFGVHKTPIDPSELRPSEYTPIAKYLQAARSPGLIFQFLRYVRISRNLSVRNYIAMDAKWQLVSVLEI